MHFKKCAIYVTYQCTAVIKKCLDDLIIFYCKILVESKICNYDFLARKLASSLFPIINDKTMNINNRRQQKLQQLKYHLSLYRLFLSFSTLHVLRAPEPFIRVPYERVQCSDSVAVPGQFGSADMSQSRSSLDDVPGTPLNQLSDVSLLMGDSETGNCQSIYIEILAVLW